MRKPVESRLNVIYLSFLITLGVTVLLFILLYFNLSNNPVTAVDDHATEQHTSKPSDDYIVYFCDGSFLCGGWGDRFRGIVASYLIANATNRKFGIQMNVPCDISNYLLPNQLDWRIDHSKMNNDSQKYVAMSDLTFRDKSKDLDFDKLFPHRVTYFSHNLDIVPYLRYNSLYLKQFQWMSGMKNHEIYRHIYRILFRFTPQLDNKLLEFNLNRSVGVPLTCAQIRLGRNSNNEEDTEVRTDMSDVNLVWDLFHSFITSLHDSSHHHSHSHHHGHGHHHGDSHHHDNDHHLDDDKHHNHSDHNHGHDDSHHHEHSHHGNKKKFNIFVTSDSEQVRADAAARFPEQIVDLPGDLVHIERSSLDKQRVCDGFSKVLLDQVILASCETLVISRSGFGEISAYLRGKDENLYCLRYTKLYKCTLANLDRDMDFIQKIVLFTCIGVVLCCVVCCIARVRLFMRWLFKRLISMF